ncbi:recombinase family protein [Allobranchiibius sp. GilTou38]|nr:recombinase family protein [Allobranchiibius sp. GilTou38]
METHRAITYSRQSKAREDDSQSSPEAQRTASRAMIAARGWEHVGDFEDVGKSGYDPKVHRPGLEAALATLERGEADRLVVYRLDRLTRQGVGEAVDLVETIQSYGAAMVSATESFFDLASPMGVGIFGLFAAMAKQESYNISSRTRAGKAELRAVGSASGGRPIFGMTSRREVRGRLVARLLEPDPVEALILREVVARVIEGESVRSVCGDLNDRKVRTKTGSEWGPSTLTRVLRSPSIGGYMPKARAADEAPHIRNGRAEIQRDPQTGEYVQPWAGAIDTGTFHRLQDVLDARVKPRGRTSQASLFGGFLLRCASCKGPMSADHRGEGMGSYRCSRHRRKSIECKGAAVSILHADRYVADAVFSRIARLDVERLSDAELLAEVSDRFAGSVESDPGRRAELQGIAADAQRALERLDDDRAAGVFEGDLGTARYKRQIDAQNARLALAAEELAKTDAQAAPYIPFLDPANLGDEGPFGQDGFWTLQSVEGRREFLSLFLDAVDVRKSTRNGGGNAPFRGKDRLALVWAAREEGP